MDSDCVAVLPVRVFNLAMEGSPMPVAVSSNLKIRSSAYHVFRGPAPPEPFSLLSLLLPSE